MKLTPAFVTTVLMCVVGGLVVAYVARKVFAQEENDATPVLTKVVAATSDLAPGTVITSEHLGFAQVFNERLSDDIVLKKELVLGRIVKNGIKTSSPIRLSDLHPAGHRMDLQLAEGMRAVTITVNDAAAITGGLIQAGDYVDVHFTPMLNGGDQRYRGGFTMTLFVGVRVLAINTRAQAVGGRAASAVALELSEQQANILIQARNKGELTLTLNPNGRGSGGIAVDAEDRAYLDEILGLTAMVDDTFVMEIYTGSARGTYTYGSFVGGGGIGLGAGGGFGGGVGIGAGGGGGAGGSERRWRRIWKS